MSDDEKLSPERAVRLLRAKAGALENYVRNASSIDLMREEQGYLIDLSADIALIASLLADHIERSDESAPLEVEP